MGAGAASPLRPVGCPKTTQVEPAGDDGAPRNLVNFWGDELQFGPPGEPKLLRRGIGTAHDRLCQRPQSPRPGPLTAEKHTESCLGHAHFHR